MDSDQDLGELVFQYKDGAPIWLILCGLVALVPGGLAISELSSPVPNVDRAGICLIMVLALIVLPFFLKGRVVRFHTRGLTESQPMKETRNLRYDEIEHMTWSAVKPAVGVFIRGELIARGGKVAFSRKVDTGGKVQRALEDVRDRITSSMSPVALRQIEAGQPFAWGKGSGPRVRLRHDGLVYRPVKFLGPGDDQIVPWTTPLDYAFADGFFAVATAADRKALFTIACSEPDFYPGFAAFEALRAAHTRAGRAAS
jgi:hypothetical protein